MVTVAALDASIERRHLLKHPFYRAWSNGQLDVPTLRTYAGQYFQFESAFPRFLANAYAQLDRAADRRVLLSNLIDEEGRDPTHPALWLDFARSLGSSARSIRSAAPFPTTRSLLDTYARLTCGRGAASALGAVYAYESIFPEIAAEKSRGLRAFYGIHGSRAHEFFRVHTVADVEHSAAERRLLAQEMTRNRAAGSAAASAVRQSTSAWWRFLDGFGVPMGATS